MSRLRSVFADFFAYRADPSALAVFRIVVFSALIFEALVPSNDAVWFSGLPSGLRLVPTGWGFLPGLPGPDLVRALLWIFIGASTAAALGWRAHVTCWIAAGLSAVILGIPHFFDPPGRIITHHHHLVWFAFLLAASPSADTLSLDAARRPRPAPSTAYGFPLRVAALLIGLIYFFPGFWKLAHRGAGWLAGDDLRMVLLIRRWLIGDEAPFFRLENHTLAYRTAALAVILFEMSFVFFLFWRRARNWVPLLGLFFHLMTGLLMRLSFWPLAVCYVVFVRWGPAANERDGSDERRAGPKRLSLFVGGFLLAAAAVCGVLRIDSWPFAHYPVFDDNYDAYREGIDGIRMEAADARGRMIPWDEQWLAYKYGNVRWKRVMEHARRLKDNKEREKLLKGAWKIALAENAQLNNASVVRFFGVKVPLEPVRQASLGREELLLEFRP